MLVIISLGLLLTACSFQSDNQAVSTQAARLPVETQNADRPATPNISATPAIGVSTNPAAAPNHQVRTCRLTRPPVPRFVPSDPAYARMNVDPGYFLYGTDSLWTELPADGNWSGLPLSSEGYTQKVFWWSKDYFVEKEPWPQLSVTGHELDAPIAAMKFSGGTNAGNGMLVGVNVPEMGCWEITGRYRDAELRFVVWVGP